MIGKTIPNYKIVKKLGEDGMVMKYTKLRIPNPTALLRLSLSSFNSQLSKMKKRDLYRNQEPLMYNPKTLLLGIYKKDKTLYLRKMK